MSRPAPMTAKDVPTLRLAQKLLEKGITQAAAAMANLNLESEDVSALSNDARRLTETLDGNIGREEWSLEGALINAATLGLSILIGKVEKIKDAQTDLLLPVHETADKADEFRELHDRCKGLDTQRSMFGGRNG